MTTFFLSVSFAVFGFSLQVENPKIPTIVPQVVAITIYWFAYLLFLAFNDYTQFLRQRLAQMETSKQTPLDLQTASQAFMQQQRKLSATKLLLVFGIFYTLAGVSIGLSFSK